MNTITPTTAKAYFLTDGTVRDNYGDALFHPLSTVNDIEIYVEDGDSDNVMTINYNPAIIKKWATHWFPCFYRGLVEHTLDGESEPRTFAQYRTSMPVILSSMNQNSETSMSVVSTLRQQAGNNLIGSYATVASLPTSYGDWADLQDMEENDVVAYVYEAGVNGFYMVEYVVDTYVWTLKTSGITNYTTTKQYDTWALSVQGGFANPGEITELSDEQYRLIWQELSSLSGYYDSNYDLIQELIDGTTPAGRAVADQNGNVIDTTYQLLSNLVTAFQVTPDDTHYASEKLIYDTIQNILNGTTPFTVMTLYNANGNAVFTIDDEGVVRVAHAGINHELGENLFVRGEEVGTILNGDTVMYDGSIGASGKMNVVTITISNIATLIANPHYFLGVSTQDFSGIQNRLNWYGGVSNLNTVAYTSNVTYPSGEGKVIYVDMVNGGLTYIRPAKPLPVIEVGVVVTYHATEGRVLVRPTFSTALGDLHDVDLNGGVVAGDVIIRNAGNTKFEAFNLTAALLLKVDKVTGSSLVTDVEIAHLEALDTQAQFDAKFALKEDKANKGVASGYVPLNANTKIDAIYVPGAYDDYVEYPTYADLPTTGTTGILYVVIADETSGGNTSTYRWTGSVYIQLTDVLSSAEVKVLYEANANTNAYIDADKAKMDLITITVAKDLDAIEAGAQVNVIEVIKVNGVIQTILSKIVNLFVPTKTSELTNDGEDTSSAYVTFDDLGSAGFGDMTEGEYATNGEIGVVDEAVLARTAQQTIVIPLTKGTLGKYYATVVGFALIQHNSFELLFPNSTTDLTENVEVSLNGVAGTYKDLKYEDTLNNVVVKHTSNAKATVYYDGTELFMKGQPLLDLPFTFDSIINSNYGNGKPIKGSPEFNRLYGLSLNSIAYDTDVIDTGTINFDSVSGINYYDYCNGVLIAGTGSNIVVTNNTGVTHDMMIIPITNTPLYNHTAPQINSIVQDYFEDYTHITDFALQSIGLQMFNELSYTTVDYAYKVRVKPSTNIAWSISTQYKLYDIALNEISTGTALTVATTSETAYISFVGTIADKTIFMLNEGTTAEDWVKYNSPQDNFVLLGTNRSVGTDVRDEVYPLNGAWWFKQYVGYDYNDVVKSATTWTYTAGINNSRFNKDLSTELGYKEVAVTETADVSMIVGNDTFVAKDVNGMTGAGGLEYSIGTRDNGNLYITVPSSINTTALFEAYLQANDVEFIYEYDTPLDAVEIEKNGSLIQESNTTFVQVGNFATQYDITLAMNINKLVAIHDDKIQALQNEIEQVRWTDLVRAMTPQFINPLNSKPDYDYTNIGLLFPQNDTTEQAIISYQMPHSYKEGSNIRPHLHVGQALDLQAVFKFEYKWVNIGGDGAVANQTITFDQYAIEYISGTLHQVVYSNDEIDGTGKTISSILKGFLYRDDNVYTGDMLVTDFDIHYQEDSNGSREEYVK